jgi:microcystin-dependent protein
LTAGTSTAYQVTSNTVYTALVDGLTVRAKVHATNDDSATFQLDTTTAKPIHRTPGQVVVAGDTLADVPYDFVYSSSHDAWLLVGVNQEWETGDIKLTMRSCVGAGWLLMNDGTIGDATSGATYASANARALFALLWNSVSDTYAPVVTGRGATAAADWAAHKRLTLTKILGRSLIAAGQGSGLTLRTLGETLGTESNTLAFTNFPIANIPVVIPAGEGSHAHAVQGHTDGGGVSSAIVRTTAGTNAASLLDKAETTTLPEMNGEAVTGGAATPISNMSPVSAVNVAIHL